MNRSEVCEARATRDNGSISSIAYSECMGNENYNRKNENASRTRQEEDAGTIPRVELTNEENVLYELTGDNAYRVTQIAHAVSDDSRESNNMTEEDLDAVLAAGCMPDGTPLTPELRRALEYMKGEFHDMTDERNFDMFDTGDLSADEITEWARDEHDTTLDQAIQKKEQQKAYEEQEYEKEHPEVAKEEESEERNDDDRKDNDKKKSSEDKDKSSEAMDVLEDPKASPEDKLKAIQDLKEEGHTEIVLFDNGRKIRCRIAVEPVAPGSSRNYVHLFAVDDNGRELIVLRGLEENGHYSRQGTAGYVGDRWSRQDSNIA